MENVLNQEKKETKLALFFKAVGRALKNKTLVYIVKRVLSLFVTALLIVALVTLLIRLIPDYKLIDQSLYKKFDGQFGYEYAERYKNSELFRYGRVDINGNRIPIIQSIFEYIYWILPIPKKIPIKWSTDYSEVMAYWEGTTYFGRSVVSNKFVLDEFTKKIGISFEISLISIFFAYLVAYPLGIAMAKRPGGFIDKAGNVFVVLNYAIPGLVFYLFMNKLLSPIFGFGYDAVEPEFSQLIPGIFCMAFLSIPGIIIWLRRFMLNELNSDYVKFARSKGLSENRIMYTHVLRNAIVPLARNIPGTFLGAIVGSYFVEKIWSIPGTGDMLISALTSMDVAVIQSLTVIYSIIGMIAFLLGDLITIFLDPRIKLVE